MRQEKQKQLWLKFQFNLKGQTHDRLASGALGVSKWWAIKKKKERYKHMRLLWIRDIVTTSGHSSIASINLPDSAKHKPLYFIKGQFVKMDASTEDEEIDALLDKYELNQIKDYDLIKKGNVASCVGKNGGKISINNCFVNCEYNPETRPYKLGCSVFVAVKE